MKNVLRLLILITLLGASGVMMYVPYVEMKHNAITSLNEKQMLLAKQAAVGIENFFEEQRTMLRHLASQPVFVDFGPAGKDAMRRTYSSLSNYIKAITLYDAKGVILYSYPDESVTGRDISSQPHVQKILKDHKTIVSDVFTSVQGIQAVALSEPVFRDGVFVGVIGFLIDFKHIAKTYIEDIRIGKDGYAWMISRDGTELYCPVPGHTGVNVGHTSAEFPSVITMASDMKKGLKGVTTYSYDRVKDEKTEVITKHAVYYPVELYGNLWSITVATPESEVYSELSSFYRKMMGAVFIFLVSVLLFLVLIANSFNLVRLNKELEKRVDQEMEKRKEQEKMMLQQARFYSMGETMNAIAHQWRQPLNSIGLCIQDIEEAYRMGQMNDKYVTEMVNSAMSILHNLSATIDDFRDFFAHSEKPEEQNVCQVLLSIQNIIMVQYKEVNIKLTIMAAGSPIETHRECRKLHFCGKIYPDLLKQVVLGCLQNSKEAILRRMEKKEITEGAVTLVLTEKDGEYLIEITDNGGGIPKEHLEKIFDPYFTTKDISIGMGLGLYMAKNITEDRLKGSLTIENFGDGTKTLIRFKAL